MAASSFRLFITGGTVFTEIVAFILLVIAICGPAKSVSLANVHYMRLELSDINLAIYSKNSTLISALTGGNYSLSGEDYGFVYTYSITPWGYCYGGYQRDPMDYNTCTDPEAKYYFDLEEFLNDTLANGDYSQTITDKIGSAIIDINLPDKITDFTPVVQKVSSLVFVLAFINVAFIAINVILGLAMAKSSKFYSCVCFILSTISFVLMVILSAAATGVFSVLVHKINNDISATGINAYLDHTFYGLIWSATIIILLSTIGWMIAVCFGTTRVDPGYQEVKG